MYQNAKLGQQHQTNSQSRRLIIRKESLRLLNSDMAPGHKEKISGEDCPSGLPVVCRTR